MSSSERSSERRTRHRYTVRTHQVYADRRELQREVPGHGGKRSRESRDERGPCRHPTASGAAHEEQGPTRTNPVCGVPSDLQRQQQMSLDVAARLCNVQLHQRRVVRTRVRHPHVVDRRRQLVEECAEPFEVGGVEGGSLGAELGADAVQTIGIARSEDQVGLPRRGRAGPPRARCPSCRRSRRRFARRAPACRSCCRLRRFNASGTGGRCSPCSSPPHGMRARSRI